MTITDDTRPTRTHECPAWCAGDHEDPAPGDGAVHRHVVGEFTPDTVAPGLVDNVRPEPIRVSAQRFYAPDVESPNYVELSVGRTECCMRALTPDDADRLADALRAESVVARGGVPDPVGLVEAAARALLVACGRPTRAEDMAYAVPVIEALQAGTPVG